MPRAGRANEAEPNRCSESNPAAACGDKKATGFRQRLQTMLSISRDRRYAVEITKLSKKRVSSVLRVTFRSSGLNETFIAFVYRSTVI